MEIQKSAEIFLKNNDVVHTESRIRSLDLPPTFRLEAFLKFMRNKWIRDDESNLVAEGIACEILRPGQAEWEEGKICLRITFIPNSTSTPAEENFPEQTEEKESNWPPSLDELMN